MGSDDNENLSRKEFLKGMAGAAFCCAMGSLSCSKKGGIEDGAMERTAERMEAGEGNVQLAAACGTYCGACPAYLNKHGNGAWKAPANPPRTPIDRFVSMMSQLQCDGCLSGGVLAAHCRTCNIRLCAANKQKDLRCTDCNELPCNRITSLINQGNYPHRREYLPNLEKIRQMGAGKWVKAEEAKWQCPKCGKPLSWYDAKCEGCGEARSGKLFSLTVIT